MVMASANLQTDQGHKSIMHASSPKSESAGYKTSIGPRIFSNPADEEMLQSFIGGLRADFQEALKLSEQTWLMQMQETIARENQRIMETVSNQVNASCAMMEQTLQMQVQMQSEICKLEKHMTTIEQQNIKQQMLKKQERKSIHYQKPSRSFDYHRKPMGLLEELGDDDDDDNQDLVDSAFRGVRGAFCFSGSSSDEFGMRDKVPKLSARAVHAFQNREVPSPTSKRQSIAQVRKLEKAASFEVEGNAKVGKKVKISKSALRYRSEPTSSTCINTIGDNFVFQPISMNAALDESAFEEPCVVLEEEPPKFIVGLKDQPQETNPVCPAVKLQTTLAPIWHDPSSLNVTPPDPTKAVRATLNSQNMEVNTNSSDDADSSDNPQDMTDIEALFAAIERDDIESCTALLKNPELHDINEVNDKKLTVLHKAALRGLPSVVELILNHPKFTQANALMPGGLSALHGASFNGFKKICELLLSHRSFTIRFHKDDAGWTALDHAERFGGSAAGSTAFALRRHGLRRGHC